MENKKIDWEDKPEVKKGAIGERIVNEILSNFGYIVYRPISDGAHKIDFFAHKESAEKKIICIEAKAKKRMAKYYETGFNYNAYLHYKEIQEKHHIDTFVYFIDDFEECIYGQWLNNLGEGRTIPGKTGIVIVWDLCKMQLFRKLTNEELIELSQYTKNGSYDYSTVEKYFDDDCYDEKGNYKNLNK